MQTTINERDTLQEEPVSPAPEHTPTPETPEQQQKEETPPAATSNVAAAIAPLEEEIIDGEVTAIIEPERKPQPKQRPYYLIVVGTVLACFLYLAGSLLLPLFTPSATVLIIPLQRSITTTTAIQVHGRALPTLTLSQSQTAPATGKRHQDATQAHGEITFYNGLFTSQTIASGTILTGIDGVQVVTDQLAVIPAANPPYIGQVTVRAHALDTGLQGNIQAYDISKPCCVTAVKAVNTSGFSGGHSARDYVVVTHHDLTSVEAAIKTTLGKSEQAALNAQVITDESITPPLCSQTVTSDHRPGEEAANVTVTVSVTCSSIAYYTHAFYMNANQMLSQVAYGKLGTDYSLPGDTQVQIVHATITDQARGIATLRVKLDATYIYQITPGEAQQLVHLIAGKSKSTALHILVSQPGIQGVQITVKGGNQTLPQDPGNIKVVVVYRL